MKKTLLILLTSIISHSQSDNLAATYIRHFQFESALSAIDIYSEETKENIKWQVNFLKDFAINDPDFSNPKSLPKAPTEFIGQFYHKINLGDYYFYRYPDKNIEALAYYKEALNLSISLKKKQFICIALCKILSMHRQVYFYNNNTYKEYLDLLFKQQYELLDLTYYLYFKVTLDFKDYNLEHWDSRSANLLLKNLKNSDIPMIVKGNSYYTMAIYHEERQQRDSIWYYIKLAQDAYDNSISKIKKNRIEQLASYRARIALQENKLDIAKASLMLINNNSNNLMDFKVNGQKYYYEALIDTSFNNFKSAFKKYHTYERTMDNLRAYRYNNLLNDLETKYHTTEKENQLYLEQQKNKQQKSIAFILASLVILVSMIGYLIQKNTKRKQLLAEQEKALESQKLSTVLKEQELKSIDAMIAGQEKERQRIANDLHDDLGSLMANVKLHFDALKDNPSPDLYTKANSLIETAYDKIRGMAHAKNSGVMANKGLLKAINDIANSNSIANKLHIQVVDYGLEQQLENSLELTIFRIIQELIANIVKHAEATEATIHITNHENTINLMVEDNGKGFDTKAISQHQGMGIHSIDKRIENLGGTVTIESEINKGTTVIIDIPTL
jgi:signal transduction histidine kinase